MMSSKTILPFQATFYDAARVGGLKDVVSPPYDVISESMRDELYALSPYNFCRVDYAKEAPPERYAVAGKTFSDWLSAGILTKDLSPGFYFHHHSFTLPDGRRVTRKGFFAVRRLEAFGEGGVKPHEKTLDAPKQDRLLLMRATKTQLSPVFSLYSDPENRLNRRAEPLLKSTPLFDFTTAEGERHRVWKTGDEGIVKLIDELIAPAPVFIADGHHRYETALNYRNEILAAHAGLPDAAAVRYVLMYFCGMEDDGLVILPIHRALHGLGAFDTDGFLAKLSTLFTVKETPSTDHEALARELELLGKDHHAYALVTKDRSKSYLVFLEHAKWLETAEAKEIPAELASLDVTVLHRAVLQGILGISEEAQARQDNIAYFKTAADTMKAVWEGSMDLGVLLNPTRIGEMREVALAGHKMPQKSTFFYPKIASGLLLHDVDEDSVDGF